MALMDLHEIRKRNFRYLADDVYGREKLSQALGYPDNNYINGVCAGHTKLGTANAKRFGLLLGLGENWLNTPHDDLWLGIAPATQIMKSTIDTAIAGMDEEDLDLLLALARRLSLLKLLDRKEPK